MRNAIFVAAAGLLLALGACTDVGDCPAASAITPGGSCSGDSLECPYTLQTASPACDGTTVEGGLATSCVCQKGTWSCPSAVTCPSAAGDDGAVTGDDGAAGDDSSGGGDDSAADGAGDDGG